MELNINLLPKPKKKGYDLLIIVSLFMIAMFYASYHGIVLYLDTQQQIKHVQQELLIKEGLKSDTLQEILEHQSEITEGNYMEHYSRLHAFLNTLYLDPSIILKEIADQLPANGKLDSLSFQHDGKINIEGTFKSKEKVAAFLHHLLKAPSIKSAQVDSIMKANSDKSLSAYRATFQISFQASGGELDE